MKTIVSIMVVVKVMLLIALLYIVGVHILPLIFKAVLVCFLSFTVIGCLDLKSAKPAKSEAIEKNGKTKRFNNK